MNRVYVRLFSCFIKRDVQIGVNNGYIQGCEEFHLSTQFYCLQSRTGLSKHIHDEWKYLFSSLTYPLLSDSKFEHK
jgi:hypothetical protein